MNQTDSRAAATRKAILAYARRHQKPGSGSAPWDKGTAFVLNWPDLTGVLEGISWAIVGAVATRNYMPERATLDLDIAILPADSERVAERLRNAGYKLVAPLSIIYGSNWQAPGGQNLDIIEGQEPWWQAALQSASNNRDQMGAPVLPLRYLVIMKLLAGRAQDVADVTRMLGHASEDDLRAVREAVSGNNPELLGDLEGFIELGKLETGS